TASAVSTNQWTDNNCCVDSYIDRFVDSYTDNACDAGRHLAGLRTDAAARGRGFAVIDDPRPHDAGEAGHGERGDRRRASMEVMEANNNARGSLPLAPTGGRYAYPLGR